MREEANEVIRNSEKEAKPRMRCLCTPGCAVNRLCPVHGEGDVAIQGVGVQGAAVEPGVDFEPFEDRVLVKRDEAAMAAGSVIEIPDSQKEEPLEGRVLKVGRGRWERGFFCGMQSRLGDHVLFGRNAGTPVWVDGVEYLLLREEEILGRRPSKSMSSELGSLTSAQGELLGLAQLKASQERP